MSRAPAIVALTREGGALARRIAAVLPGAEVHGLKARIEDADVTFAKTAEHLCALFEAGQPIVGVCAAGVLIRALAPRLEDKRAEPPVIALAEDQLMDRLKQNDAAAIIKVGRHFAKVRRVLEALDLAGRAVYVEHATMASQRVLPLDSVDPAGVPYFSMILVHKKGKAWR